MCRWIMYIDTVYELFLMQAEMINLQRRVKNNFSVTSSVDNECAASDWWNSGVVSHPKGFLIGNFFCKFGDYDPKLLIYGFAFKSILQCPRNHRKISGVGYWWRRSSVLRIEFEVLFRIRSCIARRNFWSECCVCCIRKEESRILREVRFVNRIHYFVQNSISWFETLFRQSTFLERDESVWRWNDLLKRMFLFSCFCPVEFLCAVSWETFIAMSGWTDL